MRVVALLGPVAKPRSDADQAKILNGPADRVARMRVDQDQVLSVGGHEAHKCAWRP